MTQPDGKTESATLSPELAGFLVQLSIGLHKYGTYPKGHPIIETAASAVYTRLVPLLATREALAIGIARDQLIIEGSATDVDNAVLRDLARRFHRHQIAVVSFLRGVAPEELVEFLQAVSTEANRQEMPFGLRPPEEIDLWQNIKVEPFSFERLTIGTEGGEGQSDGRLSQLWLGLASAALRKGRADDDIDQHPSAIGAAIAGHRGDTSYDQIIVGYLQQLGRELKARDGESLAQLQSRVTQLLSSLDKETISRLVNVGGDLATRHEFVADFAASLPVRAVLDLVQAAGAAREKNISHSLLRMLTKLADHADRKTTTVSSRADETFRGTVRDLLSGWTLADPNPEQYTMVLDQLATPAETDEALLSAGDAAEGDHHLTESPRIVRMALELDIQSEAVTNALGALVDEGRLEEIVELLDGAPEGTTVLPSMWELLAGPQLLGRVLDRGETHVEIVDRILKQAGASAVDSMLDALATTESRAIRHRLLNALTALGSLAGPPAAARLRDAEWFVQRNLLIVLGSLPQWPADFDPATYAVGDDHRVCREAFKLMLSGTQRPGLRPEGILLSLDSPDDAVLRMGLTAALEDCPSEAEPHVIEHLTHKDEDVRVLAYRVLAGFRSKAARDILVRQVMAPKKWWRRARLTAATPEMLAALHGLVATWRRHPDAAGVMRLAAQSRDPDVRDAAGLE